MSEPRKPAAELSDEELFEELREQVNRSRNTGAHVRKRVRELGAELRKRDETAKQSKSL